MDIYLKEYKSTYKGDTGISMFIAAALIQEPSFETILGAQQPMIG
jgi:hypothetical protein